MARKLLLLPPICLAGPFRQPNLSILAIRHRAMAHLPSRWWMCVDWLTTLRRHLQTGAQKQPVR